MNPALLLIDLQKDYLAAPRLQPAAGAIVQRAALLLEQCRGRRIPVIHIWTTVQRQPDNRMPHWKSANRWTCVSGTEGHRPPCSLRPLAGETVLHKQFFSAFGNPELDSILRSAGSDTLILAGVHSHACIRATALDGYQRGYAIRIADDAVGSDDPLHAASTRRYLARRGMRFDPVGHILSASTDSDPAGQVEQAVTIARRARTKWRGTAVHERANALLELADLVEARTAELSEQIADEVGKPITMAIAEVHRSAALCRAAAAEADRTREVRSSPAARYRHEPLGVVAIVTPWNNPLAIPVGKIAPAILYGNTVVWKPSPAAAATAGCALALLRRVVPDGVVSLCTGGPSRRSCAGGAPWNRRCDGFRLAGGRICASGDLRSPLRTISGRTGR